MAKKDQEKFYLGNPALPKPDTTYDYVNNPQWVVDLDKCKKNILYFAENFFYIINLDTGRETIKLHPYQKRLLRALRDNRFNITLASRQIGKALALETPVLTTLGWKTMGILTEQDLVYGLDGVPCKVLKTHDVLEDRECYKVEFDNGEKIVADAEHLWYTVTKDNSSKKTTKEILNTINLNHKIPVCSKKELRDRDDFYYITRITQVKSVPVRCITVDNKEGIFLCGRQLIPTSNTTIMTIYALWQSCFQDDQNILIVANKESTAVGIFKRIRLAYEQLPNYLKPGAVEYGKTSLMLGNGSSIGITTTSSDAGRGASVNCCIIDEMSFIPNELQKSFWASVYPIISSSKKSKILISSTPNGTGNLFHELWEGAINNTNGWHPERVDWWEVPGRTEGWKEQTMKSIGREAFAAEYENSFLESGEASVDEVLFNDLKSECYAPTITYDDGKYQLWEEPQQDQIYVAGVDIGEGVEQAASVIQILNITDLRNIKQAAVFHDNTISPYNFTTKLHEILCHWGKPLAMIERNNCGAQVIDQLKNALNYENIVSYASKGASIEKIGVQAHTNTKYNGVQNMRYWINELNVVKIRDIKTLQELKTFIRHPNGTWGKRTGQDIWDDRVMSLIWALIILENSLCEKYFEIVELDDNKKPLKIRQLDFGIKYFMQPQSMYNTTGITEGNNVLPALFQIGEEGEYNGIKELEDNGWELL